MFLFTYFEVNAYFIDYHLVSNFYTNLFTEIDNNHYDVRKVLTSFYPKILYLSCVAHRFDHVAETIRVHLLQVVT